MLTVLAPHDRAAWHTTALQDTALDAAALPPGCEVVFLSLPAELAPESLHGFSIALPASHAAAGSLAGHEGLDVTLDPTTAAQNVYLLSSRGGVTSALQVRSMYTLATKLTDVDPDEEPIGEATLALLRDAAAGQAAAAADTAALAHKVARREKKQRRSQAEAQQAAAVATAESEAHQRSEAAAAAAAVVSPAPKKRKKVKSEPEPEPAAVTPKKAKRKSSKANAAV